MSADQRIIRFQCACGAELQVAVGQSGGEIECPSCHETVRVPRPDDDLAEELAARQGSLADLASAVTETTQGPPRRSRPLDRAKPLGPRGKLPAVELICGCLMVATLVLPWMVYPPRYDRARQIVMSWHVLEKASFSIKLLLVGLWAIGLAAILVGARYRGKRAAIAHCVLGLLGPAFCAASLAAILDLKMLLELDSSVLVRAIIALVAILLQIIATNIRLMVGPNRKVQAVQVLACVLLLIVMAGNFIESQSTSDSPRRSDSTQQATVIIGWAITSMTLVGTLLILIHAALMKRNENLCRVGLYLIYVAIAASLVFVGLIMCSGLRRFTDALPLINAGLLLYLPLVLLCLGAIKAIRWHIEDKKER